MELTSACGEDTLQLIEKNGLAFPFSMYMGFSVVLLVGSKYRTCTPQNTANIVGVWVSLPKVSRIWKLSWNKCCEAVCLECETNPLPISFYFAFYWCSLLSAPCCSKHAFLGNANRSNEVSLLPWTCARCFSGQLHSLFFLRKSLPCWLSSFFTHLSLFPGPEYKYNLRG